MSSFVLLQALEFPHAKEFHAADISKVQELVLWLENTKIRHYAVSDRMSLESKEVKTFFVALEKYLQDLGYPMASSLGLGKVGTENTDPQEIAAMETAIHWLLRQAVTLEYHDAASRYNETLIDCEENVAPPEKWTPHKLPPFKDLMSGKTLESLRSALDALQVDNTHISSEALEKARAVLETQILPTVTAQEHDTAGAVSSSTALAQFPLGFTTGDEKVDMAARILRMLYIKDLRTLQTSIDDAIVAVQSLTADPKTDAAIGRIGR